MQPTALRTLIASLALWGVLFGTHTCFSQQDFFLDFDTFTDTSADPKDYIYSTSERDTITSVLNDRYSGLDITFSHASAPSGLFSTIFFNTGLSSAEQIDFRNRDKSDTATMHIPKVMESAGMTGPFASSDVVIASINIAAHEGGHLMGLRHHDSFNLPGMGVPTAGIAADFKPVYPGPTFASLTGEEVMSLTTSIGFSEAKLLDPDLFLGPRSVAKLMLVSPPFDFTIEETAGFHNDFFSPQPLTLKTAAIPNNLPPGTPVSGLPLFVDMAIVKDASIDLTPSGLESDYYSITGSAGDLFHIEVLSTILDYRLTDLLDTKLAVFPAGDPLATIYYGTIGNDDEKESTDSLVLDLVLPADGAYTIEVYTSPDALPGFETGEYELLIYRLYAVPEPSMLGGLLLGSVLFLGMRRRPKSAR